MHWAPVVGKFSPRSALGRLAQPGPGCILGSVVLTRLASLPAHPGAATFGLWGQTVKPRGAWPVAGFPVSLTEGMEEGLDLPGHLLSVVPVFLDIPEGQVMNDRDNKR